MPRKYTDKQKQAQSARVRAFRATLERRIGTEEKQKTAYELSARLTKESASRLTKAKQHRANMDRQCHACGSAFADGAKVFAALDLMGEQTGLLCVTCRNVINSVAPGRVGPLVESEPVAEEDTQPKG